MRGLVMALAVLAAMTLGGCASMRMEEPLSCDGSDKRPLNAGKWDGVFGSFGCGHKG